MAINIRRARTEELARAVARETGESMTSAIETALAERLERLSRDRRAAARSAVIREIASDTAGRIPVGISGAALQDTLYGDDGLPG